MSIPNANWRKSSYSNGGGDGNECVELAILPDGGVAVRDSKQGENGPHLTFSYPQLLTFLARTSHAGSPD